MLADKEEVQIVDIVSSEMGYLLQKQSSKWLVVHNELIEAGTGFWSKSLHSHVADRGGKHLACCWNQLFASLLQ